MEETRRNLEKLQQNLLDLTARNRLINFKDTPKARTVLGFKNEDIITIYKKIESGKPIIIANEDDLDKGNNFKLEFSKSGSDLTATLFQIRNKAKIIAEEQGINVSFCIFGLIRWISKNDEEVNAPLLLVPARLDKKGLLSPYHIVKIDEEAIINPALVARFKNEFNLNLDIDFDEENIDDLFTKIAVLLEGRGSVVLERKSGIGLFNYLKFCMYKDIEDNKEMILDHDLIKFFCGNEELVNKAPEDLLDRKNIDNNFKPKDTFQVVDADSSQQQAIIAARTGLSFILQGPPGTGKSQTITNIISESLANNKKVLFVSEKMAALEVVYQNLKRVRLEDFILELHSGKTNKKDVINELFRTVTSDMTKAPESSYQLENLENEINYLNLYKEELHKIREPLEKSLYEIHGEFAERIQYPIVDFPLENPLKMQSNDLLKVEESFRLYLTKLKKLNYQYENSCWDGLKDARFDLDEVEEIKDLILKTYLIVNKIVALFDELEELGIDIKHFEEKNKFGSLEILLGKFRFFPKLSKSLFLSEKAQEEALLIKDISEMKEERDLLIIEIKKFFKDEILEIDVNEISKRMPADVLSPFRFLNKRYKKDLALLQTYYKEEKLTGKMASKNILKLAKIRKLGEDISKKQSQLEQTNNKAGLEALMTAKFILSFEDDFALLSSKFRQSLIDDSGLAKNLEKLSQQLSEKFQEYYFVTEKLGKYFDKDILHLSLPNLEKKLLDIQMNFDQIFVYIDLRDYLKELKSDGLLDIIEIFKKNKIAYDDYFNVYCRKFYFSLLNHYYANIETLKDFQKDKFEDIIEKFKYYDKLQMEIAIMQLREKLSLNRPKITNILVPRSDLQILKREQEKKKKIMPIRRLFETIPQLVQTIKPCFLMSPLAVSLFLNPEALKFDVVIFDEASQVKLEDAVGTIFRGAQLIIVGDREQLPPTDFFKSASIDNEDEDDEDDIVNYESILDIANSMGLNTFTLQWHYRSRNEGLIDYSNKVIYRNLTTFPSNDLSGGTGVSFIKVEDGVYDKSGGRDNKIEAKRVVDLIIDLYRQDINSSIGVVALSEAQQLAIHNELIRRMKENSQVATLIESNRESQLFIKNLENVQGDERDYIILSIGYARDRNGKLSFNFGPINKANGYRRLNVAITRAKERVFVVSSLEPEDIIADNKAYGLEFLKGYLDYAKCGKIRQVNDIKLEKDAFISVLSAYLKDQGYTIVNNYGNSNYKIDIGILDKKTQKIIIGIECDGDSFNDTFTARDRHRLREEVMAKRGWKIIKVWSTDFIKNREKCLSVLMEKILKVLNNQEEIRQTAPIEDKLEEETRSSVEVISFPVYQEVIIPEANERSYFNNVIIKKIVEDIVANEAPVLLKRIHKALAPFYRAERISPLIVENIKSFMVKYPIDGDFVLGKNNNFRKSNRKIEHIYMQELADGLYQIIKLSNQINRNDLYQTLLQFTGSNTLNDKNRELLDSAIESLKSNQKILVNNDNLSIITK